MTYLQNVGLFADYLTDDFVQGLQNKLNKAARCIGVRLLLDKLSGLSIEELVAPQSLSQHIDVDSAAVSFCVDLCKLLQSETKAKLAASKANVIEFW